LAGFEVILYGRFWVIPEAMPRMNGRALAECMNRRYPGVPIVFVSGYPESREIVAGLMAKGFKNGYTYIQKPFMAQELLEAIRTAFKTVARHKTP
jgi:FixJ family two-component response regulator